MVRMKRLICKRCGEGYWVELGTKPPHECDPQILASIQTALGNEPEDRLQQPLHQRLSEGFEMLAMSEDGVWADDDEI